MPLQTLELGIEGMTCAACATRIEKVLNRLPGVEASVNLASERARVRYQPGVTDQSQLLESIQRAGFTGRVASDRSREEERAKDRNLPRRAATLLDRCRVELAACCANGDHVRR